MASRNHSSPRRSALQSKRSRYGAWPTKTRFPNNGKFGDFFNVKLGYLLGEIDDDTPEVEMDDESAARVFTEEDDREIEHLTSMMAQLSYDTLRIVSATIAEAYRLDREKGNLRPDERVISVRTKWLDEDKGKSEV